MDQIIPEDFLCPITQELMRDPVVAADGQSYEREAITQWLQKGHKTSPLTGESLKYDVLIENHRLKAIIETFWQSLPEVQREKQIRADLDVAMRLREEMIAQNGQTPNQEDFEILKSKEEENKTLKENLLEMQRQLQEMQAKMQSEISKNQQRSVKNDTKAKVSKDNFTLKEMASDTERKFQEIQAKRQLTKPQVQVNTPSSPTKCLTCSICHLEILENLVFTNKFCEHKYCLYCTQEAGLPDKSLCYLKVCPAGLELSELTKFLVNP